jgi:Tfp pilus assembly protein PilE
MILGGRGARSRRGAGGFTLLELMVTVGMMAVLAGVAVLAVRGFQDAGAGIGCRTDTTRLRKAETTYFLSHDTYADEATLVTAGLLGAPSTLHDVGLMGSAYTIAELGACIGQGSTYAIPAPTVGTTTHSGATVSVLAADGHGVAGVAVFTAPTGQSTWTSMGATGSDGSVRAPLADGVYDVRATYDGVVDVLSQVTVTSGTVVTFPAVTLTVRLRDATGSGVNGAFVELGAAGGSIFPIGITPAAGDVVAEVLPGAYDITVISGSLSSTRTAVTVNAPTLVDFTVGTTVVELRAVDGTGLSGGAITVTPPAGPPVSFGSTGPNGKASLTLLRGDYDIALRYNGMTSTQSVEITGDATVVYQLARVTVHMATSRGGPLSGGDAATSYRPAGSSTWWLVGTPDGAGDTTVDVLPAAYDFEAQWSGMTSAQSGIAISGATTVTFRTASVPLRLLSSVGAGLSAPDAAFSMRVEGVSAWRLAGTPDSTGTLSIELFDGAYDFEASWLGVTSVQFGVIVHGATSVDFHTVGVSLQLVSSTGTGLSGQDAAFFGRPSGTTMWWAAGAPAASGAVVQEVFPGTYDFEARWFGATSVQVSVPVLPYAPPTVTFQTVRATLRELSSTGVGLAGQDEATWVRQSGTTGWYATDPLVAGVATQELFAATYDVKARWLGVLSVQSSVAIGAASTVTFTSVPLTLRMFTSTGAGLTGADEALWVRQSGTMVSYLVGAPSASGVKLQEVFPTTYDVKARWLGLVSVQSSIVISGPSTVTFTSVPVTLRMSTSTGAGLTGEDETIWVRANGGSYVALGAPAADGTRVQEMLGGTYDVKFRWLGSTIVSTSVAVSGPTAVTVSAVPVVVTCRRQSDHTAQAGATGSVVTDGTAYPLGTSDSSGAVSMQVFGGSTNFRCKLGTLIGTTANVIVPAGGTAVTVDMA